MSPLAHGAASRALAQPQAASDKAYRQAGASRRARYLQGCLHRAPIMGRMKILELLHVMVAQAFYRWAMREINPMHPDVPKIMLRQQQLAEKYRRVWG